MTSKRLILSKQIPLSDNCLHVKYFVTYGEIPFMDRINVVYGLAIEQYNEGDPDQMIWEERTHCFLESREEAVGLAEWLGRHTVTALSMTAVLCDLIENV